MREYLELFHEPEQEKLRKQHEAFIPEPSRLLTALVQLHGAFAAAMQRRVPQKTATLDMDATLVETFIRVVDGKLEETGRQWAEECFVPSWVGHKKHGPVYRYLAIREPLEQQSLPWVEEQISLPFPTMNWGAVKYKVT